MFVRFIESSIFVGMKPKIEYARNIIKIGGKEISFSDAESLIKSEYPGFLSNHRVKSEAIDGKLVVTYDWHTILNDRTVIRMLERKL